MKPHLILMWKVEELIMNVIHELAKTKTVLLISHRLANVVKSDKIYFLKDGEIKESGKHRRTDEPEWCIQTSI